MIKHIAIAIGSTFALLLAGIVVFLLVGGITQKGSAGCTLPTGRSISASAHFCVSLESSKDTSTIRTLRHEIVIAPTSLTVDGHVVGPIPSTAKNVDVDVDWNGIKVFADGQRIGEPPVATAAIPPQSRDNFICRPSRPRVFRICGPPSRMLRRVVASRLPLSRRPDSARRPTTAGRRLGAA